MAIIILAANMLNGSIPTEPSSVSGPSLIRGKEHFSGQDPCGNFEMSDRNADLQA